MVQQRSSGSKHTLLAGSCRRVGVRDDEERTSYACHANWELGSLTMKSNVERVELGDVASDVFGLTIDRAQCMIAAEHVESSDLTGQKHQRMRR